MPEYVHLHANTCKFIFESLEGDWSTGSHQISIILLYSQILPSRLDYLASYLVKQFGNFRQDVELTFCGKTNTMYCIQIILGHEPYTPYAITIQDQRTGRIFIDQCGPPAEDTMLIH
jgi:hypothetical protein